MTSMYFNIGHSHSDRIENSRKSYVFMNCCLNEISALVYWSSFAMYYVSLKRETLNKLEIDKFIRLSKPVKSPKRRNTA